MNVLYDISALGSAWASRHGLTGVARVIENVLRSLLNEDNRKCRITPCAPTSPYLASAAFRRDFPVSAPLLAPSRADRWPGRWLGAADRFLAGTQSRRGPFWRGLRRAGMPPVARTRSAFGRLLPDDLAASDIYHSPHGAIPAFVRDSRVTRMRPQIALTVYDLIPFRHPEYFLPGMAEAQTSIMRTTREEEDWFLCISECTKRDLCEFFKIDPSRVFVTPLAADPAVFYPCEEAMGEPVRRRYGIVPGTPYVMSLCTLEPRKNVQTIIDAFAEIVRAGEVPDLKLILVGGRGWLDEGLRAALERWPEVRQRILLPGFVPDEDLAPLYSGALCFAYLSYYEGFGLPPLEAMQCGIPVLTANTSSLPEVVGNAGLMFAPRDVEGLAQGILSLWRDPGYRARLCAQSLARAAKFSWARCANDTLNAYRAALAVGSR